MKLLLLVALSLACAVGAPPPRAGASAAVAAEQAPRATLNWKARNDRTIYGYIVYRATTDDGPFRRVSEILHVAPEDGAEVHQYRFVDRDVTAGQTYYYYLDTIGLDGRKNRFSGVVAKTVGEP